VKERLVIYNKEDTNGRARVTTDNGSTRTGCVGSQVARTS